MADELAQVLEQADRVIEAYRDAVRLASEAEGLVHCLYQLDGVPLTERQRFAGQASRLLSSVASDLAKGISAISEAARATTSAADGAGVNHGQECRP